MKEIGLTTVFFLLQTLVFASQKPFCTEMNGTMGWIITNEYNESQFILDSNCSKKEVVCYNIGSRSEGWYTNLAFLVPNEIENEASVACDSEWGQTLLRRDYRFCKDGLVYENDYKRLIYANCSQG